MVGIIAVSEHFTKYRPLAYSVTSTAIAFGMLVFPFIIRPLITYYGWRGALLILGGISFNLIACSLVMCKRNKIKEYKLGTKKEPVDNLTEKTEGIFNLSIFHYWDYVLLCVAEIFVNLGEIIVIIHLGEYAVSLGITEDRATWLFSSLGAANIFGKVLFGFMIHLPGCNGFHTWILGFLALGTVTLLIPMMNSYIGLHVFAGAFGLCMGGHGMTDIELTIVLVGKEKMANGLGNLMVFNAIGQLLGGPFASK